MVASLILAFSLAVPQSAAAPRLHPLELSPEMRQFLDSRVDRGLPEFQRLQRLDSAVFQDAALRFHYAPVTRTASETFSSRSGNCLSFTLLFVTMARHLELDARFREVEIAPTWSLTGNYQTLNKHLNAAVIIGGVPYVVDVFPGVNRIEIGGSIVTDQRGLAHFYNNTGADELGKGNLAAAESHLRKALESDPTAACVWINLGVIKIQAGDLREAEKYYKKAMEMDDRDPAAMSNLAVLYQRTGKMREAYRLVAKVKSFWEKNPYYHYGLGERAYEIGEYRQSIVHYKRALKLKRAEHNFHFALARAYVQLHQPGEAENSLKLALKYAPNPAKKDRYNQKLELLKAMSQSEAQ